MSLARRGLQAVMATVGMHKAPTAPVWYPDWSGETAAIVASGPSAKRVDVGLLRGRARVIAIKESHELCPWADVVYGCDPAFWRNCQGLPKFAGLKVCYRSEYDFIHRIGIEPSTDKLLNVPGTIGSGGNSGFQALNLAIQFGARDIILCGIDLTDQYGVHWFGRANGQGRANPGPWNFKRWIKAFENAAQQLPALGVRVTNCSPLTALTCFPTASLSEALFRQVS